MNTCIPIWSTRILIVSVLFTATIARGQEPSALESYIRLQYTKQEHMVPMRDGVKLFTSVYIPRDNTKTYPVLIKRTPYSVGPYGADKYPASLGPSEHFVRSGYIFVNQDVRGRFMSEGVFTQVTPHIADKSKPTDVDESSDAYDTIEWLLKNIGGHNGKAGMYGISYPGFYASAGMIDAHPALVAVSPQAPVADWYFDDFLHHGGFFLAHAFRWLNSNAQDRPKPTTERATPNPLPSLDGYKLFLSAGTISEIDRQYLKETVPFWKEMMQHPNRDEFWQKRDIRPHLKKVATAVMVVTGWYDAEDLFGSFKTYESIESRNPGVNNVLVVGPWIHGGWASGDGDKLGEVPFGSKTGAFYRAEIEFPFFERHLKGKDLPRAAEATVFETGGNAWRTFDKWPPKGTEVRKLFLRESGKLAFDAPAKETAGEGYDEYVSDPAKPVPFTEEITTRMNVEYMVDDQRFATRRTDVLSYQTEPLTEDIVLAGPIQVDLWASTSGTDSDFVVKLIDVFPDSTEAAALPAYEMMVRSEVLRGRFRKSYEKPEPFESNKPTEMRFELLDVLHRFQKGHRLMVHVQSTWFPLVDRNPQQFIPNIFLAKAEDFRKATQRVYRSGEFSTSLELRVLPNPTPPK